MERCNFIEKYLIDYLFSELNIKKKEEIENHIEQCETCRVELFEMKATIQLIKNIDEKEPARLLYYKNRKENNFWKYISAIAASIIIVSFIFILRIDYINRKKQIVMKQNQIDALYNQALKDLEYRNKLLIESKFDELEKKLIDYQNKRFNDFAIEISQQTKDLVNATINQSEQNRINDLRRVSNKIEALNQLNEYERQRTIEILNYLINASARREKY